MKKVAICMMMVIFCFSICSCGENQGINSSLPMAEFNKVKMQLPSDAFFEGIRSDYFVVYTNGVDTISLMTLQTQTHDLAADAANSVAKEFLQMENYMDIKANRINKQDCASGFRIDGDFINYMLIFLQNGKLACLEYKTAADNPESRRIFADMTASLQW